VLTIEGSDFVERTIRGKIGGKVAFLEYRPLSAITAPFFYMAGHPDKAYL